MKKGITGFIKHTIIINLFAAFVLTSFFCSEANAQYKRNVVFEEFSEVWCGSCAVLAPTLAKWIENHPDYIPIIYYSYFADDGGDFYNSPEDYQSRNSFYAVPFYPYARINSELAPHSTYPGFPTDTSGINNIIDTMSKTTPVKIVIDFVNNGTTGTVNVDVTSDEALTNQLLYVFLVEKEHTYQQQSNGLSEFHYLFRDLLTASDGESFSINSGETKHFSYDYSISEKLNFDLYATVLVQDKTTQHIYQSETLFKSKIVSVDEKGDSEGNVLILPNPVVDNFSVVLQKDNESIKLIEIYDAIGNRVNKIDVNNINKLTLAGIDDNGNKLSNGIYYLKITTDKKQYFLNLAIAR